jgi:uncharacterized protein YqeY
MTRERLAGDLKSAIKDRDAARVATLRLILAAVKDRDIATRTEESSDGVSDAEILSILAKMIKQRQESARIYDEAGRLDLAEQERSEIIIIKDYLPKQLSDREVQKAIASAIKDTGASSIRDMGRVMAHLKANHTGQMDFSLAGAVVKDAFR